MTSTLAARITKSFGRGDTRQVVLDDLALELSAPDLVVILGESGCGKTTLLNILGGLDRHFEGQLLVDGRSTADFSPADWDRFRAQRVGLVFQSPNLIGHLSVLENVLLGQDLAGIPEQEARASALNALERCGIAELADRLPSTLSGGQAQRACVARALAKDPRVILADEPTGSLDEKSGERAYPCHTSNHEHCQKRIAQPRFSRRIAVRQLLSALAEPCDDVLHNAQRTNH